MGEVREGWPLGRIQYSPNRQHSLQYQAHAGFDAVIVDARDHLEGDGVLAGLNVVHLGESSRSAGLSNDPSNLKRRY